MRNKKYYIHAIYQSKYQSVSYTTRLRRPNTKIEFQKVLLRFFTKNFHDNISFIFFILDHFQIINIKTDALSRCIKHPARDGEDL